ncbi:Mur ligase domain-containing protein, partial [Klebsiella pneumoniae]|nr:Mur ligase domain-containing protein [Klebsiella pneumoniae]
HLLMVAFRAISCSKRSTLVISELYKLYRQNPSIQTDTRNLQHGDIFFALKGDNFNGNSFALQALEAGASYAVVDEDII